MAPIISVLTAVGVVIMGFPGGFTALIGGQIGDLVMRAMTIRICRGITELTGGEACHYGTTNPYGYMSIPSYQKGDCRPEAYLKPFGRALGAAGGVSIVGALTESQGNTFMSFVLPVIWAIPNSLCTECIERETGYSCKTRSSSFCDFLKFSSILPLPVILALIGYSIPEPPQNPT